MPSDQVLVDLSGEWELSDTSGEHRCPMVLPGDAITALHSAGHLPDPYWGRNEYDCRWVAERDWVLRRTVTLDDPAVALVISGLDTVAEVWWNGTRVLQAENAFRTYDVPLGTVAKAGENDVEIRFPAITRVASERAAAQPFPVPISKNCPIPDGNLIRKPACDFGWDWNIALAPFGVIGEISLRRLAPVRIMSLTTRQHFDKTDGSVDLWVSLDVAAESDGRITLSFAGQEQEIAVFGTDGEKRFLTCFTLDAPDLWWPAGQGAQPLYHLTATCGDQRIARRIGFRQIELDTTKDAAGARFAFKVNGRDVFAKGANWIPADALAGRITPEKTRDLLQSAVDANMNMIRIWGGGRYEDDWFYDICDELGLMVWQDFMFACNLYPSDPDFLKEVDAEAREQVARLQHHACIALWCGDNELVGALDWYDCSRENRDTYLVNYDRLNRTIETALRETDPEATWWPSSPSLGPMDFRDGWHVDGQGDMHFWSVWHENRDFDHYRDVAPRFCSEFGFQSYPSMDVIRTFADPADWNISNPVFESHQKNVGGNERIAATMFRYFRWPERFEDFVWLSQLQQGLAIRTAVEQWRSLKPHCMGTLYWQLNDTWPVCSWASLDYGGGWKLLHHMARRFYAPQLALVRPAEDGWQVWAVNDAPDNVTLQVEAHALTLTGETRALGSGTVTPGPTALHAFDIAREALAEDEVILLKWEGGGTTASDIFAPRPWKNYDLRPSEATVSATRTGAHWTVTLTGGSAPAFFATVEASVPGRISDAAVHLMPGQTLDLSFTPADPSAEPTFTLRDLESATRTHR